MDKNTLTIVRAFGMEKEACDKPRVGNKPMSNYMRTKARRQEASKKSEIEKLSVHAPSTAQDVEVERIDTKKAAELHDALEKLAGDLEKSAGPLATIAGGALQAGAAAPSKLQFIKEILKDVLPLYAKLGAGAGAALGGVYGLAAPEEDESRLWSMLRRALKGAGMGAAGGAGYALGGAPVVANAWKGSYPINLSKLQFHLGRLAALGGAGAGAYGAGKLLTSPGESGLSDDERQRRIALAPFPHVYMSRRRKSASAQDTKKKDEEKDTKPGTEYLASASDEKPKKAPEKKPEKESENEVKYKKEAAGPGGYLALMREALPAAAMTGAGTGALLGGTYGLVSPEDNRSRLYSLLRGILLGGITGAGAGAGGMATLGAIPSQAQPLHQILGAVPGAIAGGSVGDALAKALSGRESWWTRAHKKASVKNAGAMQTIGTRVAELLNVLMRGKGRLGAKIEQMLAQSKRPEMMRRFVGVPEMGGQVAAEKGLSHTLDQMHGAHKSLRNLGIGSLGAAGAAGVGGVALADAAGKKMNEPAKPKRKPKRRRKQSSFGEFLKAALNEMGQPASAFEPGKFGDALREGTRGHARQDRFEELSKWSLGKQAFDANAFLQTLKTLAKETGKWGAGGAAIGGTLGAVREREPGESRLAAILRTALRTAGTAAGFRGGSGLAGMVAPDSGVAQFLGGILGSQGLHGAARAAM